MAAAPAAAVQKEPVVAAGYAEPVKAPSSKVKSWQAAAPVWPARGVAEVEVPTAGAKAADGRGARAGDIPVWVDAAAGAAAAADGIPAGADAQPARRPHSAGLGNSSPKRLPSSPCTEAGLSQPEEKRTEIR